MNLDDVKFKRVLKNFFLNEETALTHAANIRTKADKNLELARELTDIYNIISTSSTINSSFDECVETAQAFVKPKYLSITDIYAIIAEWINYYNKNLNEKEDIEEVKMDSYTVDDEPVNSWDEYFLNIARQAARNSKCFSRRIGAVLVRDKSILTTGYNGPPRGIPTCDVRWGIDKSLDVSKAKDFKYLVGKCPRRVLGYKSGEGIEVCPASHAEESAIVNCARMGIQAKDAQLYLTCGIPCGKCAVKIINAGVSEVIVTKLDYYDDISKFLFDNSDVRIRLYEFIK